MSLTPSQQDVNDLAACFNVAAAVRGLQDLVSGISSLNSATPFGNFLPNMATCALNTDGTLGTADNSPVSGHPIDPRVYPGLPGTFTVTQWEQILSVALSVGTFTSGGVVSANVGMPAIMALVAANP